MFVLFKSYMLYRISVASQNINNSAFKKEFKQNPSGFSDKFTKADEEALAVSENVRKSVIEPVLKFKKDIKDKTGKEISTLLYQLMVDMGTEGTHSVGTKSLFFNFIYHTSSYYFKLYITNIYI